MGRMSDQEEVKVRVSMKVGCDCVMLILLESLGRDGLKRGPDMDIDPDIAQSSSQHDIESRHVIKSATATLAEGA